MLAGGGLSVEVQTDWNKDLRSHGVESMFFMFQVVLVFPLRRAQCTAIALAGQSRLQSFSRLSFSPIPTKLTCCEDNV